MIKITFPDGNIKEYEKGISPIAIAKEISKSLAKEVVAVKYNNAMIDISLPLTTDGSINFYKFSDKEGKEVYWHSTAHIMAQAVKRLFPNVKVAIGPSIEEGFYYDFEADPFSVEDIAKIEKEVKKIIKSGIPFKRSEVSRKEALEFFKKEDERYKVEIINELPDDAIISMYSQGDFTDLCRGPHIGNTSKIKNFKILTTSGAYWRGNSNNTMLQRIYGISFPTSEELEFFLKVREEANKRDHRRLGKELDLFSFSQEAPGIPFYHHNGLIVINKLKDYWRFEHEKENYKEIQTPLIMTRNLWETSGHWQNYKENMFTTETENQDFAIKPMNCPGGMLWYKANKHSYRELPMRVGEFGLVHRNEFSGALSGLFRVRSFVQDDAHIFMRNNQIKDEIINVLRLCDRIYQTFGLEYHLELSTRPEEKYIGTLEQWEIAEKGLEDALKEWGTPYKINAGDGAFYGPKIDIYVKSAIGKQWQCGTVQLDMQLPEKFDLTYINEQSEKERVVMIHRALYGSIERFLGIILEHFGGYLPFWIAPVQIAVIPVSDKFTDFAKLTYSKLKECGFRVLYDERSEKVGYKIREIDGEKKVPYMLVVGEKEMTTGEYTVRQHKKGNIGEFNLESLIDKLKQEELEKKLPEGYKIEV